MSLTRDQQFWTAFRSHAALTVSASELLVEMLEHPSRQKSLAQEVADLEHAGDRLTRDLVLALHHTWITPLARDAIHCLMSGLDDVLDLVEAAADCIAVYEIVQPWPEAVETAKIVAASCGEIARAMTLLPNVKDASDLLASCRHINRHEHEADQIFRRGLARLFRERGDPLEVMKWRDILETIEMAADKTEDVANIIEGIVLEHG